MKALTILKHLVGKPKVVLYTVCLALAALTAGYVNHLRNVNLKLNLQLETANNNIEAYLGLVNDSLLALNVLKLDFDNLKQQNDLTLHKLDSVREELKIKTKQLTTAATQTLSLFVTKSKDTDGKVTVKDTIYQDSIKYNDLTSVYYMISNDTVNITLDVRNDQYLFIYRDRHYKNKKNFFKRLFTFDFKKVTTYKYDIKNTNDLILMSDVRVVETTNK